MLMRGHFWLRKIGTSIKKLLGLALSRDPIFKDSYIDEPPPFYAAHGTRGRGLFAPRDIKIWALVHNGGKSGIIFPHDMTWRRYIFLPRSMVCDAMDWTWTQGGELWTCMNIAILMNAANWTSKNKTEPNLNANVEMYATHDIKKGDVECALKQNRHDR